MANVGDDCYFFCTSTCAKGSGCPFRHVEAAKTCNIICQHWQTIGCFRPMCKFRHSDFHIQINHSEIPCFWESQPTGCNKPNCQYKHSKPRPDPKTGTASPPVSAPSSVENSLNNDAANDKKTAVAFDTFVMPLVSPVIINPDSEASNSSPVKLSASKVIKEVKNNEQKEEAPKVEEQNKIAPKVNETKKKAVVKKKKKVLKQKNGKTVPVKGNKAKKQVTKKSNIAATKPAVKRKKVGVQKEEQSPVPVKKRAVKDRIGTKPADSSTKKEDKEGDESSDSDDSIENVKVLSMEEIFRQKALESMMKKRAAEGKPMLPEYNKPRVQTTKVKLQAKPPPPKKTAPVKIKRPIAKVVKRPPTPPPVSESEEEEAEEESEADKEEHSEDEDDDYEHPVEKEVNEEEEENKSSSSTSDSDSSSSESDEEIGVRKVVINMEAEKTARDKAKASLLKKLPRNARVPSAPEVRKRKIVKNCTPYVPGSKGSAQLSIKERLGSRSQLVSTARDNQRRLFSRINAKPLSDQDGSEEDSDRSVENIKIKSLDEIILRKSKQFQGVKGNSPVKDRLGLPLMQEENEEKRQILITEDSSPKRAKKRAWSSSPKMKAAEREVEELEDERQVSATSPVERNFAQAEEPDEPESPFEALRKRILLKKTQTELQGVVDPIEEDGKPEEAEVSGKRKKHKHKHKHKKAKKVREIYVPPPRKATTVIGDSTMGRAVGMQDDLPDFEEPGLEPVRVPSVSERPKHRAGAMWAAGLSVPAKGLGGGRPQLRLAGTGHTRGKEEPTPAPLQPPRSIKHRIVSASSSPNSKTAASPPQSLSTDNPVPVVKTFSQIMAEKRLKRLQGTDKTDGQGADVSDPVRVQSSVSVSLSSPPRVPVRGEDSRPKGPITPIVFDLAGRKREQHPLQSKAPAAVAATSFSQSLKLFTAPSIRASVSPSKPTAAVTSSSSSSSTSSSLFKTQAPPSSSLSDIRPSYKTARAKKLFKKTNNKLQTYVPEYQSLPPPASSLHVLDQPTETRSQGDFRQNSVSNNISIPSQLEDASISIAAVKPQRRQSATLESQTKHSISLESDEFNFMDDGEIEDIGGIVGHNDVEPIDDLLQDIDDLLA